MTVITIANHKGGVGKTTTATTLATGLAGLGHRTLLIDTDPQGHVAKFLDLLLEPENSLFNALFSNGNALVEYDRNLVILPSDQRTVDIETLMRSSNTITTHSLKDLIALHRHAYDAIIIDTAPTLGSVQLAALLAADWLLIPASPEFASDTGVAALTGLVRELQEAGQDLNLLGILPTLVDRRSNEHRETLTELHTAFPGLVLPIVRRLIAIAEAPREGKPIWEYSPQAAQDYALVLAEVVRRCGL